MGYLLDYFCSFMGGANDCVLDQERYEVRANNGVEQKRNTIPDEIILMTPSIACTRRIQEVFLVAIPLVLLPLVCSALSEVNFEGDRVVSNRQARAIFLSNHFQL